MNEQDKSPYDFLVKQARRDFIGGMIVIAICFAGLIAELIGKIK